MKRKISSRTSRKTFPRYYKILIHWSKHFQEEKALLRHVITGNIRIVGRAQGAMSVYMSRLILGFINPSLFRFNIIITWSMNVPWKYMFTCIFRVLYHRVCLQWTGTSLGQMRTLYGIENLSYYLFFRHKCVLIWNDVLIYENKKKINNLLQTTNKKLKDLMKRLDAVWQNIQGEIRDWKVINPGFDLLFLIMVKLFENLWWWSSP